MSENSENSDKTIDDWIRDNPVTLIHMLRGQIAASHTIVMAELRTLQGRPFDLVDELNRLSDRTAALTEFFDMDYERELARRMREKRADRRRQLMRSVSPVAA